MMIDLRNPLNVAQHHVGRGSVWAMVKARLALWHRNHRTRRQLWRLNDRQRADIGLVSRDQRLECEKWFWQC